MVSDLVSHFANGGKVYSAEPICVDAIKHYTADQDRSKGSHFHTQQMEIEQ